MGRIKNGAPFSCLLHRPNAEQFMPPTMLDRSKLIHDDSFAHLPNSRHSSGLNSQTVCPQKTHLLRILLFDMGPSMQSVTHVPRISSHLC
jgi:hypothetical protein